MLLVLTSLGANAKAVLAEKPVLKVTDPKTAQATPTSFSLTPTKEHVLGVQQFDDIVNEIDVTSIREHTFLD